MYTAGIGPEIVPQTFVYGTISEAARRGRFSTVFVATIAPKSVLKSKFRSLTDRYQLWDYSAGMDDERTTRADDRASQELPLPERCPRRGPV
jgi:hypothetical protein